MRAKTVALLLALATTAAASPGASRYEAYIAQDAASGVGTAAELLDVSQADAEALFAIADAAIFLPAQRRALVFRAAGSAQAAIGAERAALSSVITLGEFMSALEGLIPNPGAGEDAQFLVKFPGAPLSGIEPPAGPADEQSPAAARAPLASGVVYFDDFEAATPHDWRGTGLNGYGPVFSTCSARSGSYSADMIRGGTAGAGLSCTSNYPNGAFTLMLTPTKGYITAAESATLEAYILVSTETNADVLTIGGGNQDSSTTAYFNYSGSIASWFKVSLDLKNFGRAGDLTRFPSVYFILGFASNTSVQAGFGARVDDFVVRTGTPQAYKLSVTKAGNGSGRVASTPAGVDCGASCSGSFESGQTVTLTAVASEGSVFAGWGGACSGSGSCTVALQRDETVTATFNATSGTCAASPTSLCLGGARFEITGTYRLESGASGAIGFTKVTNQSGYMVFSDPSDVQGFVKVINACFAPFNAHWVFIGALTDQEVHLSVKDTKSGALRRYDNALKNVFLPVLDTAAFATCP